MTLTKEKPTVGSLFSGIGGLDLGLERAGWEVRWQSEIEPFCSRVLSKHWHQVPNLGDVTRIDWSQVEQVDLICGGFPCQPVSQLGHRLGEDDDRWLWPEFVRSVRFLRPRLVLVENVVALTARGLGTVLGDLADMGYDAEWASIPASTVGRPHRRRRLFVTAYSQGERRPRCLSTPASRVIGRLPEGRPGWESEPDVARMVHGLSGVMDGPARVRALGNAVVPQVAEFLGRQLMEAMA